MNLNNNNFPVDEYLDKIETSGLDVKVIETSFANIEDMKKIIAYFSQFYGKIPEKGLNHLA